MVNFVLWYCICARMEKLITLFYSSMLLNCRPLASILLNFSSHRACKQHHLSHTAKSSKTLLIILQRAETKQHSQKLKVGHYCRTDFILLLYCETVHTLCKIFKKFKLKSSSIHTLWNDFKKFKSILFYLYSNICIYISNSLYMKVHRVQYQYYNTVCTVYVYPQYTYIFSLVIKVCSM